MVELYISSPPFSSPPFIFCCSQTYPQHTSLAIARCFSGTDPGIGGYTKLDYCCSVMVGMSRTLLRRLQSVLNAAARLVFSARRSDHITPLLRELHWLKITERIQFRLCVLAYRCLHGSAPSYLAETLYFTSEIEACRCLRSGFTSTLSVPATRRSSLGGRAFPVAAE